MAMLLHLTRIAHEPTLVFKWGGMPSAWRWRGRFYDLALLHASWQDPSGKQWYRVESREGLVFLLGRDGSGWVAALWRRAGRAESGAPHLSGAIS